MEFGSGPRAGSSARLQDTESSLTIPCPSPAPIHLRTRSFHRSQDFLINTHVLRMIHHRHSPLLPRLRQSVGLLKWIIPVGLMILVAGYEFGPARWIYAQGGVVSEFVADVLIFGTVGPVLAFFALSALEQWFEERETSDLQAEILALARKDAERSRQLNDDAIQVLFAASALISSLQSVQAEISVDYVTQLRNTETALDGAIRNLRLHLLGE